MAIDGLVSALERFERDDWVPCRLSALEVTRAEGDSFLALNDIAIVRAGQGQIRATATLDGTMFARFAGDGCIISTRSARAPMRSPPAVPCPPRRSTRSC